MQPHDPETKAAVMAALLDGQGVTETAEQYDVPRSTVSYWKSQISGGELAALDQKKANELGDMILAYVIRNIATVTSQLETAGDQGWLGKQSASEFAVLHGVLVDKAVRILGALEPTEPSDDTDQVS